MVNREQSSNRVWSFALLQLVEDRSPRGGGERVEDIGHLSQTIGK